jgi:predicted RNase H-like HicB family nuclease
MGVYQAQLEQDADGRWSSWIDELPGCAAWGHSRAEALAALRHAVVAYVDDMIEAGEMALTDAVAVRNPSAGE